MNEILIEQCSYLIDDTLPNIANISNLIALLYHEMENINPVFRGLHHECLEAILRKS